MNHYELMYIIAPHVEEEAQDAVIARVEELVNSVGGSITDVKKWGKRRLAYEINDLKEGFYVLTHFSAPPQSLTEIDRVLKLTEQIIRFLITKDETKI